MTSLETFITVHDQDLVLAAEASGQFTSLGKYRYLFVGDGPTEKLSEINAVVSRDYPVHREALSDFYDFTGWRTLANYDIVKVDITLMLQYDHAVLDPDAAAKVVKSIDGHGVLATVPGYFDNWVLQLPGFGEYLQAGAKACGVDLDSLAPFNKWPSTQGIAFTKDVLYSFMTWFEPAFDVFKDHVFAGHLAERMVWVYCHSRDIPVAYLEGLFQHGSLDCHGTGDFMRGDMRGYESKRALFARK